MTLLPARTWWTPDELAAAGLPDVPRTRQGVQALVDRQGWRAQAGFARRRAGKGGGWEYSWELLPSRAKSRLLAEVAAPVVEAPVSRDDQWTWFERLPAEVKAKAQARLLVIQKVEALEGTLGRFLAVAQVARMDGVCARTIWSWLSMIEGVEVSDRMAWLAPRNRAVERKGAVKDCDPAFFDAIKADYLRLEAPPFTDCYRRSLRLAKAHAWDILPERTMRRRLEAAVSPAVLVLARKGVEALKRMYPAQVRDKTAMRPLEAVNADFHKFDVFVRWPARPGEAPVVGRPQMVAFQDIYSGRILSWRVDVNPNATAVLLAAGDMIEAWGIPDHVLMDNGREFAAKAVTGGASTRFRFKVRDDDIPGLFVSLGCTVHWATPFAGQSKPIERAFRDMASSIAKDPRFAGAWTGNRPDAKPENHGSHAVPLEEFLRVLGEGIEEHNTRLGRRTEVACGRSFAGVFDAAYPTAGVRKATAAQRRFWRLGAEGLRAERGSGMIRFMGNAFWAPWCQDIADQRVIIRFDPADLHAGVHVYSAANAYLGEAPCREKAGFFDMDEARAHARARSDWMKAEKRALEAERRLTAVELGTMLDAVAEAPAAKPEAKVVKAVFGKGKGPKAERATPVAPGGAVVADLTARLPGAQPPVEVPDGPRERFRRALELERRLERGEPVTVEQERWLGMFQASAEYFAERLIWDEHGDAIFG